MTEEQQCYRPSAAAGLGRNAAVTQASYRYFAKP